MKRLVPIILILFLAACSTTPEVAPPIVITAVVRPSAGITASQAATAAATASPTTPAPAATTVPPTLAPSYPSPASINISAVQEPFERGFMIYLSDRKQIWIFIRPTIPNATVNFGQWLSYPDTFKEGEPETDPTFAAPTRLLQPKRGFGKVWRENAQVRAGLGWALDWEQGYNASVITYPIGTLEGGKFNQKFAFHIITTIDGSAMHVNEATYSWSKP
jgi:hypothetical protein